MRGPATPSNRPINHRSFQNRAQARPQSHRATRIQTRNRGLAKPLDNCKTRVLQFRGGSRNGGGVSSFKEHSRSPRAMLLERSTGAASSRLRSRPRRRTPSRFRDVGRCRQSMFLSQTASEGCSGAGATLLATTCAFASHLMLAATAQTKGPRGPVKSQLPPHTTAALGRRPRRCMCWDRSHGDSVASGQ
jgi:hypothetical protein